MDEVVSESGNVISESTGCWTPIYANQAVDYIKAQSKNFKIIAEALELDAKEILLSEDSKKVFVRNGQDTIAILTEDYISKEISRHMSKLTF
jgi:predicted nuclease of restriction endonuclease-like RecB superfamily